MLPIKRIDHVSMAAPDLKARAKFFEDLFGMKVLDHYDTPSDGYLGLEFAIPGSDTKFEILEPAGEDSFVTKFLAQKGSNYHHVTFEVTSIREAASVLRAYGIEPFGYREDADWAGELFIHPRDTGGVLLQLFEPHVPPADEPPNPSLYRLERPLTRAQVVAELASMPERLRSAVASVEPSRLNRAPAPGEWSAFQTLQHLRDATLTYAARFRWIIFDDDPSLPNYDEDNWVAASTDTVEDIPGILDQVAASRADLVRVLSRLPDAAWRRGGRHQVMGRVVLEHYARHQVTHEEMHLGQLNDAAK